MIFIHVDEMILRDRSSEQQEIEFAGSPPNQMTEEEMQEAMESGELTADFASSADPSVPDGRLYVQQDANYNVTSITDDAGAIVERYKFDPYGSPTYMDSTFSDIGSSAYGWQYLHQGGRYDSGTGLYHFRNRELRAADGRWLQADPLGYVDGMNTYQYVTSNPEVNLDPVGLEQISGDSGLWDFDSELLTEMDAVPYLGTRWRIRFAADKNATCCKKIGFIQILKFTKDGLVDHIGMNSETLAGNGWGVDHAQSVKDNPNPAYQGAGTDKDTQYGQACGTGPFAWCKLKDSPGTFNTNTKHLLRWEFQTFAVCLDGNDKGKVYGAFTWGFEVGKDGKVHRLKKSVLNGISPEFQAAIDTWNGSALTTPFKPTPPPATQPVTN